jgi:hypothetical protein
LAFARPVVATALQPIERKSMAKIGHRDEHHSSQLIEKALFWTLSDIVA